VSELFAYWAIIVGRGKGHGNISVTCLIKMVFHFWIDSRRVEPNPNTTCEELDVHVSRKSV
jgi:hypothetical protein